VIDVTDDAGGAREERPLTDQERADLYREQLKQLRVIDLVRDMMVTLVTVGYEKLGLTEQTRELRDLRDARVAIESLRRLIEVVEGEGDPEAASLRSTLAQMQLNFARASAEPSPSTPRASASESPQGAPRPPAQEPAAASAAAAPGSPTEPSSEPETIARVEGKTQPRKTARAPRPKAKPAEGPPTKGGGRPKRAPTKGGGAEGGTAAPPRRRRGGSAT
jgi:hypothetical protein